MLKSQDVLVVLKLVAVGSDLSFGRLASQLRMSPSEVHQAFKRAELCGLVRTEASTERYRKEVNRLALQEFLVHGLKYVFPALRGGETRGMPTAADAPVLRGMVPAGIMPAVWPDPEGSVRGLDFQPLYRTAAQASRLDPQLYDLLALVDAIRGGRAREKTLAAAELERRLFGDTRAAS